MGGGKKNRRNEGVRERRKYRSLNTQVLCGEPGKPHGYLLWGTEVWRSLGVCVTGVLEGLKDQRHLCLLHSFLSLRAPLVRGELGR